MNRFVFLMLLSITQPLTASELSSQKEALFKKLQSQHQLTDSQVKRIREIFSGSKVLSQGNPKITKHPMTASLCRSRRASVKEPLTEWHKICGGPHMAPLYDPASQKLADAKVCIDQFEWPNIPCEYPVVWVRAAEAAHLCQAMGKRICDAHEWEGACAGRLQAADYDFSLSPQMGETAAIRAMRKQHNRSVKKVWSYGAVRRKGICAMNSSKSKGCNGGDWRRCGSNTYPAGSFPECKSRLGVYDLHGNAAEHMNLPVKPDQLASRGSQTLGHTEMKGSWFIFDRYQAHKDHCRWRAPYWHGTKVMHPKSHHNYHLGFRCCKNLSREKK